jgi:hypothetical protein
VGVPAAERGSGLISRPSPRAGRRIERVRGGSVRGFKSGNLALPFEPERTALVFLGSRRRFRYEGDGEEAVRRLWPVRLIPRAKSQPLLRNIV